jgi:hypothetical protein
MDARRLKTAWIAAALLVCMGAGYRTPNFVIQTSDSRLAEHYGKVAEQLRRDLAVAWLGKELPNWSQPCPVAIHVGPTLGAGGATTFYFDRGEVYGWRMNIQGSAERIQDSVLPHEITHMIFASHFRKPLPRWADEGGATTVEHVSEQAKHKRMLIQFLQSNRGIAFNQMYSMTEYPADVMPLYAQAYSLVDYLIQQVGRRQFIAYLGEGMEADDWTAATEKWYGVKNLGTLQNQWLAWVAQGSPALKPRNDVTPASPVVLASATERASRPEPNLIYRIPRERQAASVPATWPQDQRASNDRPSNDASPTRISTVGATSPAALPRPASARPTDPFLAAATAGKSDSPASDPRASGWRPLGHRDESTIQSATLTRPQPIEEARQIVVDWGRR